MKKKRVGKFSEKVFSRKQNIHTYTLCSVCLSYRMVTDVPVHLLSPRGTEELLTTVYFTPEILKK